jgi:hypothetical protein
MTTSPTPPAEGERRAQSGYQGQYQVSALIIYQSLRHGRLEAVRIADPEAGRVDDLQLVTAGRVDGFQVKWSEFPGAFTWNDLTKEAAGKDKEKKPPLIAQLADGWKRLRSRGGGRRAVVHLVTNDLPSSAPNANLPVGEEAPKPKHFAAFLEQVFFPAHRRGIDEPLTVLESWGHTWDQLVLASGLTAAEFQEFVRDCVLSFGYTLSPDEGWGPRDGSSNADDVREIARRLPELVVDKTHRVEISRDELIVALGWQQRFQLRRRHEFPHPAFSYVAVESTRDELVRKLDASGGGYLAVVGPPGSGKSTLLTETLRTRQERVVRYYAYVPDDPGLGRGEAKNFLHDLVLQLENAGIRPGGRAIPSDLNELAEHFRSQLSELHRQWTATGMKTVILVDGLDHVEREEQPMRSFLAELPPPNAVPPGVIIVLGTQTEHLSNLSTALKGLIAEGECRIEIDRLGRLAVFRVTREAALSIALDEEQLERVYELAEGHPLALYYLLRSLSRANSEAEVSSILENADHYAGDIRIQYRDFWSRYIANNRDMRELLSLMACTRTAIDLDWALTWADEAVLGRLRALAYHYFREEGNRWYFHHSSFREFVIEEASKNSFGKRDEGRVRALYSRLADLAASAASRSVGYEELFLRFQAREHDKVLLLATQQRFREQLSESRPVWAIVRDIEMALRASAAQRDVIAFARLLLALKECKDRAVYVEDIPFPQYFLALGETSIVIDHVRERLSLRRSEGEALDLARDFEAVGLHEEARTLFELGTPSDLLRSGNVTVETHGDRKQSIATRWARAAVSFRPLAEVIESVRRIRFREKFKDEEPDEAANRVRQNGILVELGHELMDAGRWDDLERLAAAFDVDNEPADREAASWLGVHASRFCQSTGDTERSRDHLWGAMRLTEATEPSGRLRVALAIGALSLLGDPGKASEHILGLGSPHFGGLSMNSEVSWRRYRALFDLERARYACGDRRPVEDAVPEEPSEHCSGPSVALARDVVVLARLSARRWTGEPVPSVDEVVATLGRLIRRFHGADFDGASRVDWYPVLELRDEFMDLVVLVARGYGFEFVEALGRLFEVEWEANPTPRHWPDELKRSVLLNLHSGGISATRIVEHLDALDERFPASEDVHTRVAHCKHQIEAYLEVGEKERARKVLGRLVRTSSGVWGRKDYQLNHWIDWFDRVFDLEPSEACSRVQWFARAVLSLRDSTEEAHYGAAAALLEVVARRSPGWAVRLLVWFHQHRLLNHEEGVEILLRHALTSDRSFSTEIQTLVVNSYLPISSDAPEKILVLLFDEYALVGDYRVLGSVRLIVDAAKRYSISSSRIDWLRTIEELLIAKKLEPSAVGLAGVDADVIRRTPTEESWNTLVLADGRKLSREEVISQAGSADDLLLLMSQESHGPDGQGRLDIGRFDWSPVLASIAPRLSYAEIGKLESAARSLGRKSAAALSALALRAAALGQKALALRLGEDALKVADPVGWATRTDGGSRLRAAEVLRTIDPAKARELSWSMLERDLSGGVPPWSWITYDLPELANVLAERLQVSELYREVEEHARAVFSGVEFPTDAPDGITDETKEETWGSALGGLLEFQLTFPANWIANGAQRCVVQLLLGESKLAASLVERLLAADEASQEVAVEVLDSASLASPDLVRSFETSIRTLESSPHLGIRRMASGVLNRLGLPPSPSRVVHRPLSPIYSLALAEQADEQDAGVDVSHGRSSAEAEALEVVHYCFKPILRLVGHSLGIPYENLIARLLQILGEVSPAEGLAKDAGKNVEEWMSKMGIRMVYRRPRYFAARKGVFHLLAELLDARRLSPEMVDQLWPFLRYWDPTFLVVEPIARPGSVNGIVHEPANARRWVEAVDSSSSVLAGHLPDGRLVLAERSELYIPAWEKLQEVRESQIMSVESDIETDSPFFELATNQTTHTYAHEEQDLNLSRLVIQNFPRGQDSPCSDWIALNPSVGKALGWKADEEGLFRWVDPGGTLMAETLWWVDGPVETAPPENDMVGEGCLVVVSAEALDAIRRKYGSLVRSGRVARTGNDGGHPVSRVRSSDTPM